MRTAIFPARGNSQRIPRKNIREFLGKPMMQWPIEAAQQSGLFDHIVVSTDDDEIADLALQLGCEVHRRSTDDGTTGTQEIAARVLEERLADGEACVIYPCSPLLTADILTNSHLGWRDIMTGARRYLYSVTEDSVDAGCFYWGDVSDFIGRIPLEPGGYKICFPGRFIDINTLDDLAKAEEMFRSLNA